MTIKKKYLKTKPVCKITFIIPSSISKQYNSASIVGTFNDWNKNENQMIKLKTTGEFKTTLNLQINRKYYFRYLLDEHIWHNDESADAYEKTEYGDSDNCVLNV